MMRKCGAIYNFCIPQGRDFDKSFIKKDGNGVPVDLTGYTARMQIRSSPLSPNVILELTTENGRIVVDGLLGKVTLILDNVTTAGLTFKKAVYDIELIDPAGKIPPFIQGNVTLDFETTRQP